MAGRSMSRQLRPATTCYDMAASAERQTAPHPCRPHRPGGPWRLLKAVFLSQTSPESSQLATTPPPRSWRPGTHCWTLWQGVGKQIVFVENNVPPVPVRNGYAGEGYAGERGNLFRVSDTSRSAGPFCSREQKTCSPERSRVHGRVLDRVVVQRNDPWTDARMANAVHGPCSASSARRCPVGFGLQLVVER
jgi:hypothetical protein